MADITIDQLATLTFYQIPEIFFSRIQYSENGYVKLTSSYTSLSSDAKLSYGTLYNRCKLSISSFQKGNRDYVDENVTGILKRKFLNATKTTNVVSIVLLKKLQGVITI